MSSTITRALLPKAASIFRNRAKSGTASQLFARANLRRVASKLDATMKAQATARITAKAMSTGDSDTFSVSAKDPMTVFSRKNLDQTPIMSPQKGQDSFAQVAPSPASRRGALRNKPPKQKIVGERFKGPSIESMSPDQLAIYNEIAQTRTTGVAGPFGPWLANPRIARPAQELGRVCRYETTLSSRQSEMAILMTARHHTCPTEWTIHLKEARRAGLEESIIESLELQDPIPSFTNRQTQEEDQAIFSFTSELLASTSVSDETYAKAKEILGVKKLVELTSIIGYYTYVAMTLNVFQIKP